MSYDVTPEQAVAWRKREEERFRDGTYTKLPLSWMDSGWFARIGTERKMVDYYDLFLHDLRYPDHYAHVSIEKVAMVAFTENDKKGVADRQTRMTPGRYLTRFFSDKLTKEDIQYLATEMGSQYNDDAELSFAVTADEFEYVYTNGPHSCMQYQADHFSSPVHPVRVYAGHDLQLAYLTRDDRITARALVWPEKSVYGRVYGDAIRLEARLKAAGYGDGGDGALLGGAKITKLMKRDNYVIPYLDHLVGARDEGKHLVLVNGDMYGSVDICADCQNGLSGHRYSCDRCDCSIDEDDRCTGPDGEDLCEDCYGSNYARCAWSDDTVPIDEIEEVRTSLFIRRDGTRRWNTAEWGERARDRAGFYCEVDEVWYSNQGNSLVGIDGVQVGPEALFRDYALCADTGEYVAKEDAVTLESGVIWSKEHFTYHGTEVGGKLYAMTEVDEYGQVLVQPAASAPAQVSAYTIQHQPSDLFPWKVFRGDTYIEGWGDRRAAEEHLAELVAREVRFTVVPGVYSTNATTWR